MEIKKKFRKVVTVIMSLAMIFSLSGIDAFASETQDIQYDGGSEVIFLNADDLPIEVDEDVNTISTTFTKTIAASTVYVKSIGSLSANQTVKIKISSTKYPVSVGLWKSTSSGTVLVNVKSAATVNATVSTAGTYYLAIANTNSSSATVTVTYTK